MVAAGFTPLVSGDILTRDQINEFVPQVWAMAILRYRDRLFHMANITRTLNVVGKKGDTAHFPRVGRLGVRRRTAGQPVYLQSQTPGRYRVTLTEDVECSYAVDDLVLMQSQYATMAEYARSQGEALVRDLDNFLLGLRATVPLAHNIYRTTGAGAGTPAGDPAPLDSASIEAALELIMRQDGDLSMCKWVFSPTQVMDLMAIDRFISSDYALAQLQVGRFRSGVVGMLYNIPVHVTTQISNNSLDGLIVEEGATGSPTPGVQGSLYVPNQEDPGTTITYLPRGKTGSEVLQPFQTGMLVHPDWSMLAKQKNITIETDRVVQLQADISVGRHVYGGKSFYPELAVLLHSQGVAA